MIVVRMRDEYGVRGERWREVVTHPHAAGKRINEKTNSPRRVDAKTRVSDVLEGHLPRLQLDARVGRIVDRNTGRWRRRPERHGGDREDEQRQESFHVFAFAFAQRATRKISTALSP